MNFMTVQLIALTESVGYGLLQADRVEMPPFAYDIFVEKVIKNG